MLLQTSVVFKILKNINFKRFWKKKVIPQKLHPVVGKKYKNVSNKCILSDNSMRQFAYLKPFPRNGDFSVKNTDSFEILIIKTPDRMLPVQK